MYASVDHEIAQQRTRLMENVHDEGTQQLVTCQCKSSPLWVTNVQDKR